MIVPFNHFAFPMAREGQVPRGYGYSGAASIHGGKKCRFYCQQILHNPELREKLLKKAMSALGVGPSTKKLDATGVQG